MYMYVVRRIVSVVTWTSFRHTLQWFIIYRTFVCSSIEFYDELSKVESSVDLGIGEGEGEREGDEPPLAADFSVKALKLSGLTVELGNEHVQDTKLNGMPHHENYFKATFVSTYTVYDKGEL